MNKSERVPIVRKECGTIYGRVIDTKGRLGRFEVISEQYGHDENVYHLFKEAENKLGHYEAMFSKRN